MTSDSPVIVQPPTVTPSRTPTASPVHVISTGEFAGVVIGVILLFVFALCIAYYCVTVRGAAQAIEVIRQTLTLDKLVNITANPSATPADEVLRNDVIVQHRVDEEKV